MHCSGSDFETGTGPLIGGFPLDAASKKPKQQLNRVASLGHSVSRLVETYRQRFGIG
jgi:hypothetical protein